MIFLLLSIASEDKFDEGMISILNILDLFLKTYFIYINWIIYFNNTSKMQ